MTPRTTLAQMLAFRAWMLRTFAGQDDSPPPEIPAYAAQAILERERCAMALAGRLGARVPPAVRDHALRDAQVTLIRQAPLGQLGALGAARGFPVVALKTSAHSIGMPSLDLDVLVPRDRLAETVAHLESLGHRSGSGYLDDLDLHNAHLPGRGRPGEMMIEVHFELGDGVPMADQLWNRLRPHPSHRGVYRLPAERHAWHVLWHSVVVHTHRRGQLGDLLLLADTLNELDPGGRAWLEQQVRDHPATAHLLRALRMADGLRLGTAPADEFRAVAAAHYRLRTSGGLSRLPARARKQLEEQWFDLVEGERVGPLWKRLVRTEGTRSARPWLHSLEHALPRVTKAARTGLRAAVFLATIPIAKVLAANTLAATRAIPADSR